MQEIPVTFASWDEDDVINEWSEIQKQLEEVKEKYHRPSFVFRYLLPGDPEKKLFDLNDESNFYDLVTTYLECKMPEGKPPLVLPLVLAAPTQTTWNPEKEGVPGTIVLKTKNTFLEFSQAQRLQDILKKNVTSPV